LGAAVFFVLVIGSRYGFVDGFWQTLSFCSSEVGELLRSLGTSFRSVGSITRASVKGYLQRAGSNYRKFIGSC
jgi:hypothetical protein